MTAPAPPCVGRLHGVLAVLPSTRIAAVAHVRIDQSFSNLQVRFKERCDCLSPNQSTALADVKVRARVGMCFEQETQRCLANAKIGSLYRACVKAITGVGDERG
jgi:hypothetical protein